MLYTNNDVGRMAPLKKSKKDLQLRPPYRHDYGRLIHSAAFRRLQGKTQLFPGLESDFFRNRLTHSLEVAQIAKSIAMRINGSSIRSRRTGDLIDVDLVEFAGLAHDLGHPPFGHHGEEALDSCMKDAGGFEGNAQTLRILARLEKKGKNVEPFSGPKRVDTRSGLNLTFRTLASILKYDVEIPVDDNARPEPGKVTKGYYASESEIVDRIRQAVVGATDFRGKFKTIECQIMDVADDIAYSTYDLEDAMKANFVSPMEVIYDSVNFDLMAKVAEKVSSKNRIQFSDDDAGIYLRKIFLFELFDFEEIEKELKRARTLGDKAVEVAYQAVMAYGTSCRIAQNGYSRNTLTSELVDRFIKGVRCRWNPRAPAFSKVYFSDDIFKQVETLKNYTYEKLILSSRLKVAEYRGKEIVTELFDALSKGGALLLPPDFKEWFDHAPTSLEKKRVICDFIAGMTDSYAIEFYGRLKSENPQSIFKPI
jgi:dGTPase